MSYLRPITETGATARAVRPAIEPKSPPMHDARDLTADGAEARIVLDGAVYTLRITRLKKLILTK